MTIPHIQLSAEDTALILEQHSLWYSTGGKQGSRANFNGKLIREYKFSGKELRNANFQNAKLVLCDFNKVDLSESIFADADVIRCEFQESILYGVDFRQAALRGCDFSDAKYLTLDILRRANLRASIMPDGLSFDGLLEHTNELIKKSRNIMGSALLLNIAILVALMFHYDYKKITDHFPVTFSVFGFDVDINTLIALPCYLLILSLIAKFYSLSIDLLRRQVEKIPSIFPDGRFAFESVFPWFWLTWAIEIDTWLRNEATESNHEKNMNLARAFIMAFIGNLFFITIFSIIFITAVLLNHLMPLSNCVFYSLGVVAAFSFVITVVGAIKYRSTFYGVFGAIGVVIVWSLILFYTRNYEYTLLALLSVIMAWWWDRYIFDNQPFMLDLSFPDSIFHSDTIKSRRIIISRRFYFANIIVGLFSCLAVVLYLYEYRFVGLI